MDTTQSSSFPGVTFTGAFLTEGLKQAVAVPLIQKGEGLGTHLANAEFFVELVNNSHYEAHGTATLGGKKFYVDITVRLATNREYERAVPAHCEPPGCETPVLVRTFSGVGGDLYTIGTIEQMTPLQ